jgi:hypothetical protein
MTNKGILAISVFVLPLAFLTNSRSQKQEEEKGISTTIVVSRQRVLPYEPVSVALLVRNETTADKRVVAAWCSFLHIGKKTPAGTKWRGYRADNEPLTKPCLSTAKDLLPGETKQMLAHIDYESPSGGHVFGQPGKYLLQGGTMDNGRFLSDEIEITVRVPEGIDARAYEFLRTSNLHHFFGEYTIHKYDFNLKTIGELEKFIIDFDGSEYSYLARMGLAFMWLKGVEGKQDQSRAMELLTQVAERAGDPLASSAEYHLGRIEYSGGTSMPERQQKIVKANYHFRRVLNGTPSPYFRYLAEEALRPR